MSQEKKKNLSEFTPFSINSNKIRIGIVVSEWNDHITDSLLQGARQTLLEHGVSEENIVVHHVPGSFELPSGADLLYAMDPTLDAVICIGCIIQGETRHFEFIAQAVAQGIMRVGLDHRKPTIFSVLTTNDMRQAEDRAGGVHGNKGVEGAVSCLKMIALRQELEEKPQL
jgi:6,7-dimethyl-8-ribityllumazine synthase